MRTLTATGMAVTARATPRNSVCAPFRSDSGRKYQPQPHAHGHGHGHEGAGDGDRQRPLGAFRELSWLEFDAREQHEEEDAEIGDGQENLVVAEVGQDREHSGKPRRHDTEHHARDQFTDERGLPQTPRDLGADAGDHQDNEENV